MVYIRLLNRGRIRPPHLDADSCPVLMQLRKDRTSVCCKIDGPCDHSDSELPACYGLSAAARDFVATGDVSS